MTQPHGKSEQLFFFLENVILFCVACCAIMFNIFSFLKVE